MFSLLHGNGQLCMCSYTCIQVHICKSRQNIGVDRRDSWIGLITYSYVFMVSKFSLINKSALIFRGKRCCLPVPSISEHTDYCADVDKSKNHTTHNRPPKELAKNWHQETPKKSQRLSSLQGVDPSSWGTCVFQEAGDAGQEWEGNGCRSRSHQSPGDAQGAKGPQYSNSVTLLSLLPTSLGSRFKVTQPRAVGSADEIPRFKPKPRPQH